MLVPLHTVKLNHMGVHLDCVHSITCQYVPLHPGCVRSVTCHTSSWLCSFRHLPQFILVVFIPLPVTLHPGCVHSIACLTSSWLCLFRCLSRFIQVVCIPSLASLHPGCVHCIACLASSWLCSLHRLPHFIMVVFMPSLDSLHPGCVHCSACLISSWLCSLQCLPHFILVVFIPLLASLHRVKLPGNLPKPARIGDRLPAGPLITAVLRSIQGSNQSVGVVIDNTSTLVDTYSVYAVPQLVRSLLDYRERGECVWHSFWACCIKMWFQFQDHNTQKVQKNANFKFNYMQHTQS